MRYVDDSDPDIVYQNNTTPTNRKGDDVVTIGVHDLVLNKNCSVFDKNECEKVFVSVEFLDYPAEELETPYALPKGEPNTKYSFNFQKGLSFFFTEINLTRSLNRMFGTRHSQETAAGSVGWTRLVRRVSQLSNRRANTHLSAV